MVTAIYKKNGSTKETPTPKKRAAGARVSPEMTFFQKVRGAISSGFNLTPAVKPKPGQTVIRVDWDAMMKNGVPKEKIDRETQEAIKVMVATARRMRLKR